MFKTSETRKILLSAILRAKKNFDPVVKDATNPYFKSKYETLNAVLDAVEPALNAEGVTLEQPNWTDGVSNFVTTRLEHIESGEFTESTLKLEKTGNMQEVGAATTYGRRQTLKGLLGLKAEDDDGNAASGKKVETATKTTMNLGTGVGFQSNTPTTITQNTTKKAGRPAKNATTVTVTSAVVVPPTPTNGKTNHTNTVEEEW